MTVQKVAENQKIKAEIIILSYQQEEFLVQALDSVLQQKTNFPFRIIVSDDGSTDHTVDMVKTYQKKYPGKIRLITTDVNTGSLGNVIRAMEALNCEYFAVLDGDDFWVGDSKLQKQVDFLDQNLEYSSCGGQTRFLINGKLGNAIIPDAMLGKDHTFEDEFRRPLLIHTSSLLLRNIVFSPSVPHEYYDVMATFENCAMRGENFRRLVHVEHGPCKILPDLFSVYRIHKNGVWSGASNAKKAIEEAIFGNYVKKYYYNKYPELQKDILEYAENLYRRMWATLINEKYVYPQYRLTETEGKLLIDYLDDLNREKKKESMLRQEVHF